MEKLFSFETEDELDDFLDYKIEEYHAEGYTMEHPDTVFLYFCIMMHYILKTRPVAEHDMGSVCRLLGATQKEGRFRSPFFSVMAKSAGDFPGDEYFSEAARLEKRMNAKDINDAYDFLEWLIMQEEDEAYREEILGELAIDRVRYMKDRKNRVILKRSSRNRVDMEPEFRAECEAFVRDYTPTKIKEYLDRFIIGQDEAKKNISIAIYNHYLRILHPEQKLIKSNLIMIGPSGCGKTEIIRRISDLVNVPVVISDFSGVVATPWKGRNKEEALQNLYYKTGNDQSLTEMGIVFYDEFDKIIPVRSYVYGGDINNELQGQMLGMMEGTTVEVPLSNGEKLYLNTENMLFICAGAFEGLEDIVKKDLPESERGFGMPFQTHGDIEITEKNIKAEHLMKYGMKPELAGRIGVLSVLKGLSREDMKKVLTEPEDSILKRYQNEFMAEDEVQLAFTEDALDAVIDKVMEMDIGARALNAVLHDVLADAMFEVPTMEGVTQVVITGDVVRSGAQPSYR